MFWWKNKEPKPLISIKYFGGNAVIDIDKSVTPQQYVRFVSGILGDANLPIAVDNLEMNGHCDVNAKIQEQLLANYKVFVSKVTDILVLPTKDQEVIKPSRGIINNE